MTDDEWGIQMELDHELDSRQTSLKAVASTGPAPSFLTCVTACVLFPLSCDVYKCLYLLKIFCWSTFCVCGIFPPPPPFLEVHTVGFIWGGPNSKRILVNVLPSTARLLFFVINKELLFFLLVLITQGPDWDEPEQSRLMDEHYLRAMSCWKIRQAILQQQHFGLMHSHTVKKKVFLWRFIVITTHTCVRFRHWYLWSLTKFLISLKPLDLQRPFLDLMTHI